MSINAATASTYMPAFSPESGISLPVLYHDLGGKVIYATPEHKLVVVRAYLEDVRETRVFVSTNVKVLNVLYEAKYDPTGETGDTYFKFDGLVSNEFAVITNIHAFDRRGPRLEVSESERTRRLANLSDEEAILQRTERLLSAADEGGPALGPALQAEAREKALRSGEWLREVNALESNNSTIERDVRRVEATLQEATASMQLRPVSDSPAQLMDLARRAPDRLTDGQASKLSSPPLTQLLNEFMNDPVLLNRIEYPYACCGFICQNVATSYAGDKAITIYTRRLGPIIVPDLKERNAHCFTSFMVIGPEVYRTFDFHTPPPSFKSTKYVSASNIECKGYALMAKADRNVSESRWLAWCDHTGLMHCMPSCARTLKKKYSSWQPTLQMVMFDAHSINGGKTWEVKNLCYIDYDQATTNEYWPREAYFVPDLRLQPGQRLENREFTFVSEILDDCVSVKADHVEMGSLSTVYGAVVITEWSTELRRKFKAIFVAPLNAFHTNVAYLTVAKHLRQFKKTDLYILPSIQGESQVDYPIQTVVPQTQQQAMSRMNRGWEDELLDVGALRQASAASAVRPVTAAAAGAPSSRPAVLSPAQSTCRPLVSRYSQPQPFPPQSSQRSPQQSIPSLLQIPIANQTQQQQQQQPQAQPVNATDRFTHSFVHVLDFINSRRPRGSAAQRHRSRSRGRDTTKLLNSSHSTNNCNKGPDNCKSISDPNQTYMVDTPMSPNDKNGETSLRPQKCAGLGLLTKMLANLPVEIILLICEYPEFKDLGQLAWTNKRMMQIIKRHLSVALEIAFERKILFYRPEPLEWRDDASVAYFKDKLYYLGGKDPETNKNTNRVDLLMSGIVERYIDYQAMNGNGLKSERFQKDGLSDLHR
ncbi:hypothetical protein WR25_15892 [Diploscapter pachys]|uniref:F-box domain-containing protein n=1 Tax=Diploscapter pachys TaxID=2018661 RepID=A0A2A2L8Y4_9BILA|nr:hypothetical protein WR25_15892 [Diploscapter pachys]